MKKHTLIAIALTLYTTPSIFTGNKRHQPNAPELLVRTKRPRASMTQEQLDQQLFAAAGHDLVQRIGNLLQAGANIKAKNQNGWTALHFAADNNAINAIALLVEAGAEIETGDEVQKTPLHRASEQGHSAAVAVLLKAGARTDKINMYGGTPLHSASYNGHHYVIPLLVKAGAAIEVGDANDKTALHAAAEKKQETSMNGSLCILLHLMTMSTL